VAHAQPAERRAIVAIAVAMRLPPSVAAASSSRAAPRLGESVRQLLPRLAETKAGHELAGLSEHLLGTHRHLDPPGRNAIAGYCPRARSPLSCIAFNAILNRET
jgi:hypothetical protein